MRKLVCAVMAIVAMLAFTATAQASGGHPGNDHGTCHSSWDRHDDGCCDDHGNWRDDDKNKCCDDHGSWRDDDKNNCCDDHGDWRDHDKSDCDDDRCDHHNCGCDKGHHDNGDDDNCGDDSNRDSERYALH